jgi:hypothetical protein
MHSSKIIYTLLADHYLAEQQVLADIQKNLLAYNKLLKSAVILLVFISELDDFALELKLELKKAIYERADKRIFYNLYERIQEALMDTKTKRTRKK